MMSKCRKETAMPTNRIPLLSLSAVRTNHRPRRLGRLASLALALLLLGNSPAPAQVATEALVQLEMLDTPIDDLTRLATTYADALRDLKSARLSLETMQSLRPSAVITNLEVQIANVNLEAAQRKVEVLRSIVEKQLAAAENKLEIVSYLERLGSPLGNNGQADGGERNYIRANDEATVKILKTILSWK
jgi:hypothetical protein